jgi:hypothetical protein
VVLDDIYDIYGTLGELAQFTDAIERWEAAASEQLPEYMKGIYLTIFNFSNEVAEHVRKTHGCDVRFLLKKAVSRYGVSESVILAETSVDTASSFNMQ